MASEVEMSILKCVFPTFWSLLFYIVSANAECPHIVTKLQWGGRMNKEIDFLVLPVNFAIIEHTAGLECDSENDCSRKIYNIQTHHMDQLDYQDIGYNFLIGGDGKVYEGTGWNRVGAHTYGWNSRSIGIAFMGDFSDKLPTSAALEAAKKLLDCGVELGKLKTHYKLYAHRQLLATESPGLTLYRNIIDWPHFAEV